MKKNVFIVVILAVALVFGYKYYQATQEKDFVFYGNVEIRQVNLAFKVSGEIAELKFEEGDTVKADDVLAKLDTRPYEIKLAQAKAKLQQSEVMLDNVNVFYRRNIDLCKKKVISNQQCDDINAKKKEAEAGVKYVEHLVEEAQMLLDYTVLKAPSGGVIITRINEVGAIVGEGRPIYTLSLDDKMWVRVFIEEPFLGKVRLGGKVAIHTDGGRNYNGHIGFISPVAEFTPKNIETPSLRTDLVYRAKIVVDNADQYMKQGMPVTVKLIEN
jgi:HlyD family secretion protein